MHDPGHPLYLPLFVVHIVGVILFAGALVVSAYWKIAADRTNDAAFVARSHRRLRKMDTHLVATGAALTFVGGYAMVRFLGGRIAQHGFVLWGLILMFFALALWYFGMRNLSVKLAVEAEAAEAGRRALDKTYGKMSAAWVAYAMGAITLVLVVVILMVFKLPSYD